MHRLSPMVSMAFIAAMVLGVAGVSTQAQQAGEDAAHAAAGSARFDDEFLRKPEILRRIGLYEAAEQSAERTHPGLESMVKIYSNLAALYESACMYTKSEGVMRREISLLRSGPQDELADAIGHLAILHVAMAEPHQAEKDELEALRIRESVGDAVGTARSWSDLANVYVKNRQYKKALDFAQRAMPILADNPKADVADRVAVRQALANALCGLKQCGQAIPLLKETVDMEKSAYGANSLLVGASNFLLGHTYWMNGDMQEAADLMARGTARMKDDLGWGHTIYLNAMSEYAKFLRQRGQLEAAASAEREIKMANAVVDARSLSTSTSAFIAAGSR